MLMDQNALTDLCSSDVETCHGNSEVCNSFRAVHYDLWCDFITNQCYTYHFITTGSMLNKVGIFE